MFGRSRSQAIKDNAVSGGELALALARDRKFREQLGAAIAHGAAARRRAASRVGLMAAAARLAADEELRSELKATIEAIQAARRRADKQRSHTLRTTLLVVAGIFGAVAAVGARKVATRVWDVLTGEPPPHPQARHPKPRR
jgi:hypothetical protein